MRRYLIWGLSLGLCLLTWSAPRGWAQTKEATKPARQGTLTITSIPAGSEVFVASVRDLGVTLSRGDDLGHTKQLLGFKRMSQSEEVKALEVVNERYRRGVTPLSLTLAPGPYIVFLTVPAAARLPQNARMLIDALENDSIHGPGPVGLIQGRNGRASVVDVTAGKKDSLIQLWLPQGASLAEIEEMYPQQETFKVDERAIPADLAGNLPQADMAVILRLLRKGGKVVYRQDKTHRLLMQLDPTTGKLGTLLRYED